MSGFGDVAEVWACPECGAEIVLGIGTGVPRMTTPPRCAHGEMEQKLGRPEHAEQIDRALTNPDFRIKPNPDGGNPK